MYALIEDRSSAIVAATLSTRAQNEAHAETVDSLKSKLHKAELEKEYLSGERLKPSELVSPPPPAPPRGSGRRARGR